MKETVTFDALLYAVRTGIKKTNCRMISCNGLRTIYRPHCYISLWILCSVMISFCSARGPHHPRGEVSKKRVEQQKHINEHLAHNPQ